MPMARITLFWCFENYIFLTRMMEFQVKFCHHSGLRLWRTWMLFLTKSKGHKSKFPISGMYRFCFIDLKVHFWWPNKWLFWGRSSWNTLYMKSHLTFIEVAMPRENDAVAMKKIIELHLISLNDVRKCRYFFLYLYSQTSHRWIRLTL